jgi:medium-chain acyl-[acyl-carrier-protein] hydrolase
MRLICFPFAGGGTIVYSKWRNDLHEQIELCAINLPGRERLIREPCLTDYQNMITIIASLLENEKNVPMIFFGHSFGGLTAYLISLQLSKIKLLSPKHVFISGRRPPLGDKIDNIASLDQENFKKALINRYQGIPQEILNSPELLNFFLPIIHNDFKMYEQFPEVLKNFPNKLINCDITTIGFSQDFSSEEDYQGWSNFTNQSHQHIHLPGGHFAILKNWKPVTDKINHLFLESQ